METGTPLYQLFLSALDAHIDARIEAGTIKLTRMRDEARVEAEAVAKKRSAETRGEMAEAVIALIRNARRPGI